MQMVYSSPKEPTTSMFFPAQILCDWMTVKELTLALAEELSLKVESIPQEFQLVEELKKEWKLRNKGVQVGAMSVFC